VSRYDDTRWHDEHDDADASFPRPQAYDDLNDTRADPWSGTPASAPGYHYATGQTAPTPSTGRWKGVILSTFLVIAAFCAGWFGHQQYGNTLTLQGDSSKYAQLFQQAWTTIDQNYVVRKQVNYQQMAYAAITAMADSLNDKGHTRFLTPQELQSENQNLSGKFIGIGVSLNQDPTTKEWSIASTVAGSPAEKSGLRRGDILLTVDGTAITNKTYDVISTMIQGQEGTIVTLTVRHPNNNQVATYKIVRAEIAVQNVTMHYIKESHIAHIQIAQFAEGISDQLKTQLEAAKKMGATKIILDLRNNTGGFLSEAINTTSTFVQKGNVLLEQDSSGKRTPVPVTGGALDTTSTMVVLVNGESASASEIVSGSLKDNKRAVLIGEKTFGTGTVLQQFNLADGSAILIGTQEWLTPNGNFIRDLGITPDITVPLGTNGVMLTPNDENNQNLSQSQLLNSNDPQLISAIHYLQTH
jgi:carboxyl-terminal processing protease